MKKVIYFRVIETAVLIYECFNYTIIITSVNDFNRITNRTHSLYQSGTYDIDMDILHKLNKAELKLSSINVTEIPSPLVICFDIIGQCNMNCVYCIACNKMKDNKTDNVLTIINELNKNKFFLSVLITGGEPLLSKKFVSVIEKFDTINKAIMIDTNGTNIHRLNNKTLSAIAKKKFTFRISLDSNDIIVNDSLRGNTEIVLKAIEICIAHNIDIRVNTVITSKNIHKLDGLAKYLISKGVKNWTLLRLTKTKYTNKELFVNDSYEDAIIKKLILKYCNDIFIYYNPHIKVSKSLFRIDHLGNFTSDNISNEKNGNIMHESMENVWEQRFDKMNHIKRYIQHKGLYI